LLKAGIGTCGVEIVAERHGCVIALSPAANAAQACFRQPSKRALACAGTEPLQLTIDRVMFAPVMDLNGIGPRVTKDTITDVWMSPFPSYEDLEIKNQTRACHAAQYK
jgi:hypothetical protein